MTIMKDVLERAAPMCRTNAEAEADRLQEKFTFAEEE